MDMLCGLNQNGTTLCMVTHDPRYADMASRKLHLLDGRILDSEGIPVSQTQGVVTAATRLASQQYSNAG
jgi:putative ABC transport system ATP-binding protein